MTGLDKALYAIAANYCQSQSGHQTGRGGGGGGGGGGSNATARNLWWNKKGKMPVDPSQWKYCELCKMTCPGDQVDRLNLSDPTHTASPKSIHPPHLWDLNLSPFTCGVG